MLQEVCSPHLPHLSSLLCVEVEEGRSLADFELGRYLQVKIDGLCLTLKRKLLPFEAGRKINLVI